MHHLIPPQDYAFFEDESGISGDRFTVVGGLCMHRSTVEQAYKSVSQFRDRTGMHKELKWSKITDSKQPHYEALVELFYALNSTNHVHFHSIIFDSHQSNHSKYNQGDADIGLSKLYYQLIIHKFVKRYASMGSLFVCLDRRNSSTSLHDLRRIINAGAKKVLGADTDPVAQLISRDSKSCDLLQLNDVILGAVCAARNGRHLLANGRKSKKALAKMVLEKSGLESFELDSPRNVSRFTVWNFRNRPR